MKTNVQTNQKDIYLVTVYTPYHLYFVFILISYYWIYFGTMKHFKPKKKLKKKNVFAVTTAIFSCYSYNVSGYSIGEKCNAISYCHVRL